MKKDADCGSFTFRLGPGLHRRMKAYKKEEGTSMSDLCRRALEVYLERANIPMQNRPYNAEANKTSKKRRPVRLPDVSGSALSAFDETAGANDESNSGADGRPGVGNADEADADNSQKLWFE